MIRSALLVIALAAPFAANANAAGQTASSQTPSPIANVICEPTDRMKEKLSHQFGSQQQSMGLRGPEQVVEVWTDQQGDWTMVITYATGQSCIVAMGEAWMDTAKKDPA